MSYIAAYIRSVWWLAKVLGAVCLINHALSSEREFITDYLIYLSLVAGLAGPLSLIINKKEEKA